MYAILYFFAACQISAENVAIQYWPTQQTRRNDIKSASPQWHNVAKTLLRQGQIQDYLI